MGTTRGQRPASLPLSPELGSFLALFFWDAPWAGTVHSGPTGEETGMGSILSPCLTRLAWPVVFFSPPCCLGVFAQMQ